ncbi:hypothetical protein ABFS83_04G229300 [Erythranthe nasuta]
MDSSMEDSRVAPTTIDLQLLVIDSNAKREKMRILWYVLSMYLWSLYTSILIVWTSASSMKIFRKGEGFYILLGLTVVASVMSVYICIAAIGIIFYIRLLHTRRFDILRTWSLSKPLTILFGPVDFDAILLPLRRPDDHHASVTEESLHSSSMGDSHGVQAAVNIDSNTKKELMNEYRSKLETGIGLTLFLMFPAGMMGYVVFGGQKQVLPVFLAATVTVGVNFIVVMGKACLLLLFYFGCEDCVRALSQNAFVILLFDTINANGIFQRIQDHHQPSPLVTLPV